MNNLGVLTELLCMICEAVNPFYISSSLHPKFGLWFESEYSTHKKMRSNGNVDREKMINHDKPVDVAAFALTFSDKPIDPLL